MASSLPALVRRYHRHDPGAASHSAAVCRVAVSVARRLGLPREEVAAVAVGAVLHDVGKADVPRKLLLKPAALTQAEWEIVKEHPVRGHDAVATVIAHPFVLAAVRSHHERPDGAGYPDATRADTTPLAAQVVAVADAFSAMLEARPYRPPRAPDDAMRELERCAGSQFEVRCVEALAAVFATVAVPPAVHAAA